ncbi:hypothetical protein ACA910_000459 [Epithemia clementina (nom. ined.)]
MTGAFAGRDSGQQFPVVTAAAKLIDESGKQYAAVAHKVLYDSSPHQVESLLSIHQSLSNQANGINDRARCELDVDGNPGKQKARFNDKGLFFHFDGVKCFFEVAAITQSELSSLPRVFLTSHDARQYKPRVRTHTTRATKSLALSPHLPPWKYRLGFIPDHVVEKTLQATTQMVSTVKAETREHMRDHILTRIPELKQQCINGTACVDTFFSSLKSVRGYTCWTQYSFVKSGLDVVHQMC